MTAQIPPFRCHLGKPGVAWATYLAEADEEEIFSLRAMREGSEAAQAEG